MSHQSDCQGTPQKNPRIALAGLHMECASFLPHVTGAKTFAAGTVRGTAMVDKFRGSNTVTGGFLQVLEAAGAQILPLLHADGGAAGLADEATVRALRGDIVEGLRGLRDLDGVLVHLHGAMVTQTALDPDAETLEAVRTAVGPDLPVMVALDYHGNLDARSLAGATAAFGYRYSPHIDMKETGARAARCLLETLRGRIRPAMAIARPGLILPSIFSATDLRPLGDLVARARRMSQGAGYRDVSLFAGFAYADVPNCGASVVAVVDGPQALAQRLADDLSGDMARHAPALSAPAPVQDLPTGIAMARDAARSALRPVVLLEHADRANDSTHGLRALLPLASELRIAVPFLWDPHAVARAMAAGEGAEINLVLGGHSAPLAGGPLPLTVRVQRLRPDLRYRGTSAMRKGAELHLGDSALVKAGGLSISLTSRSETAIDHDAFDQFGLDPAAFDIVLLRSKTHFRAAWDGFADRIIIIDTPDYGPADLTTLPYRHARL